MLPGLTNYLHSGVSPIESERGTCPKFPGIALPKGSEWFRHTVRKARQMSLTLTRRPKPDTSATETPTAERSIKWTRRHPALRKAGMGVAAVAISTGLSMASAPAADAATGPVPAKPGCGYQFCYGYYCYPSGTGTVGVKVESPNGYTRFLYPNQCTSNSQVYSRVYVGSNYHIRYHFYNGSTDTFYGPGWGIYSVGQAIGFLYVGH